MPKRPSRDALVAYVPVLHRGYLELFKRLQHDVEALYILGDDILAEEDYLRKELRALTPAQAAMAVVALGIFETVTVLDKAGLAELNKAKRRLVLPDEDVSRHVAVVYLPDASVAFSPVFLRWDRQNVQGLNAAMDDVVVSTKPTDVEAMQLAYAEAQHSPDIWRRVGAVLRVPGQMEDWRASNQPLTTQNTPWAEGDPRALFKRGAGIEMSTFMHAEASLIARAAQEGVSLQGAQLYVTTFPCPPCAMLIATSGISSCCYAEGYAVLDGRRVLEEAGVDLYKVMVNIGDNAADAIPYPAK